MLKIRRPLGRLIFNMGIAIPGKTVFLIETAPCIQERLHLVIVALLSMRKCIKTSSSFVMYPRHLKWRLFIWSMKDHTHFRSLSISTMFILILHHTRKYLNKHTTSDISRRSLVCDVNPASVGSVDILDPNWVFDVASYGARTSAVTVFTTKLDVFSSNFMSFSMIQYHLCGPDDVIWNDWRGLLKSRGDSSYHVNHHEILYRRMGKVKIQIIMHDIL